MVVKVGFSRGTTWVARAICRVTHTDISHSFFYVEDSTGEWVYEAVPKWFKRGGFRKIPYHIYVRHNHVKKLVEMDWPHVQVKRVLESMLGMRYALVTFLFLGALLLLKRAARRPELLGRYGIDCVTSVLRVARQFGIEVLDVITPAELMTSIRGKEETVRECTEKQE